MENGNGTTRLSARKKFEIYVECKQKDANVGEILRRHGLHLDDLRRITERVEQGAIDALKFRAPKNGEKPIAVDDATVAALRAELGDKEQALAEISTRYELLKKSERSASRGLSPESTSSGNGDGRSWR